eukprot:360458-Chlamydomonas_euryale.AAC.4
MNNKGTDARFLRRLMNPFPSLLTGKKHMCCSWPVDYRPATSCKRERFGQVRRAQHKQQNSCGPKQRSLDVSHWRRMSNLKWEKQAFALG